MARENAPRVKTDDPITAELWNRLCAIVDRGQVDVDGTSGLERVDTPNGQMLRFGRGTTQILPAQAPAGGAGGAEVPSRAARPRAASPFCGYCARTARYIAAASSSAPFLARPLAFSRVFLAFSGTWFRPALEAQLANIAQ